jgi:predicted nucleic acid-binding Zn ribbon protein
MPIYLYRCTGRCEDEREIFWPTIPKTVPQVITQGCENCRGDMKLKIGVGVIARYGSRWITHKMLDEGMASLPSEPGDLGVYGG